MCVGENCALQAERYMNAQLAVLYENAADCIEHHDRTTKPAEQFKYSHALAEFTYTNPYARTQTLFHATFGKPEIEFICNHDAILRLKIKKSTYRLDYSKSSISNYFDNDKDREHLSDTELSFRVSFDTGDLSVLSKDPRISTRRNLVQLIALDLQKAQFVSAKPAVTVGREALIYYLTEYLVFLHDAGDHVLFSLPNYDDHRYHLTIDYSIMAWGRTMPQVDELHGVSVDKINAYLYSAWLKAAMFTVGDNTDWKLLCLAEYRTTCQWPSTLGTASDDHFILRLGAPRVKLVCSREALVYFTVDEVLFYEDADFTKKCVRQYNGWEIVFLVDIVHNSEGFVTRCVLDLASARHYPTHCKRTGVEDNDELAVSSFARIVEFFSTTYLDILETVGLQVIYYFDAHSPFDLPVSGKDGDSDVEDTDEAEWYINDITHCNMHGFDQVIAVSQLAINTFFKSLWSDGKNSHHSADHALVEWRYEDFFVARFKPMTLRLLSNGRAIIWIHLEHGHLKVLKDRLPWSESEKYRFEDWHLAFEVDLKKITHTDLKASEFWTEKYKASYVHKEHGGCTDRVLEHIVCDFSHAKIIYKFSSLESLFHQSVSQSNGCRPIEQVQAVVHYIQSHYLPHLAHSGLSIIYTVPVWKTKTNLTSISLTTMDFHVYSKTEITNHNWAHVAAGLEPVIAVFGMTQFRPLPAPRLEYSCSLINHASRKESYGTVVISRSTFMEKRLLDILSLINAQTTVVPIFSGVVDGVWQLQLVTWNKDQRKSSQNCRWEEVSKGAGFIKYRWQYRNEWRNELEGSGEIDNGTYSVHCSTRNYLELPTATQNRSIDIKLSGETDIEVSSKSTARQGTEGSSKSTARWSAVISIQSECDGLCVKVPSSLTPVIEPSPAQNQVGMFPDLRQKLNEHFPEKIDLSQVLDELKVFEGAWHYGYPGLHAYCLSNPVFTQKGDIVFELRPQGQGTQTAHRNNGSNANSPSQTISRQSSRALLRPQFLLDGKSVATTAPQGERSPTPSINGSADGQAHATGSGNGHSLSSSYNVSQEMTYEVVKQEHQENPPQLIRATEATLGLISENRVNSLARTVPV